MKTLIYTFLFVCFIQVAFTQTHSLVGAWYWSDSTKQTSIFFKPGGGVLMHSGQKGAAILTSSLREGTYTFKGDQFLIKWKDSNKKDYFKLITKDSFLLTVNKQSNDQKRVFLFRKVADNEAEKD